MSNCILKYSLVALMLFLMAVLEAFVEGDPVKKIKLRSNIAALVRQKV